MHFFFWNLRNIYFGSFISITLVKRNQLSKKNQVVMQPDLLFARVSSLLRRDNISIRKRKMPSHPKNWAFPNSSININSATYTRKVNHCTTNRQVAPSPSSLLTVLTSASLPRILMVAIIRTTGEGEGINTTSTGEWPMFPSSNHHTKVNLITFLINFWKSVYVFHHNDRYFSI